MIRCDETTSAESTIAMKCTLHIGTEKTSTSAIQTWLHLNRHTLLRHRHLYPKSAGTPDNRLLAVAAYDAWRRDDFTRNNRLTSDQSLLSFQREIITELRNELDRSAQQQDASHVIFSSEHIHSRLTSDNEVGRLRRLLTDLGFDDFTVVVYLRDPVDAAASLYSTAVLCGETSAAPPPPSNSYYRNLCDHRGTLLRYAGAFGRDTIRPRLYIPDEFTGGSIFTDFAQAIPGGLPTTHMQTPGRVNERMTSNSLRIMCRLNRLGNPARSKLRMRLQKHIRHILLVLTRNGPAFSLPIDLREQYAAAFAESDEWVRKEFFPERAQLFHRRSSPQTGLS